MKQNLFKLIPVYLSTVYIFMYLTFFIIGIHNPIIIIFSISLGYIYQPMAIEYDTERDTITYLELQFLIL